MLKLTIGNDPGMTTFAFIVAVLQVVTWPLAIVTIVVLFHGRILDAISRLAEISFAGRLCEIWRTPCRTEGHI